MKYDSLYRRDKNGEKERVAADVREENITDITPLGTFYYVLTDNLEVTVAELVEDDNQDVKVKMLDKMPTLKAMYSADDDNMQMFWLKDATATLCSFTGAPEVITF